MTVRRFSVFVITITVALSHLPARANADQGASVQCQALQKADFAKIPDAPLQIRDTRLVEKSVEMPGYCQVSGYVAPSVGFTLRLPIDGWNGKFIEVGCGGFCGSDTDYISQCDDPLHRGYACILSDMGHRSTFAQALWAYNNLQAEIDHAFRSAHVAAIAGKAIIEAYYKSAPKVSYFSGCSTGGRQAMMEAQRFPWDFDGIIAGSPSLSVTGVGMNMLWANRALTASNGESLLTRADLEFLHKAVVAKCDLNDGVKDGVIGDPRQCSFDASKLLCTANNQRECFTVPQIAAINKIYSGAFTSKGEQVYMTSSMKGSELNWLDWFMGPPSDPQAMYRFFREEFRYSAFQPNAGPTWKPEDFDFDNDYKRMGVAESLSAATNPDLRKFKAAGGKLLAFAGWNDAAGMPLPTVDYYETVEKVLGGRASAQQAFRLFMVPGMNHCGGGDGAYAVDWLTYLEGWVEKGRPPERLSSHHVRLDDLHFDKPSDAQEAMHRLTFPLDPKNIVFSRPLYPYPTVAIYLGHGDPKDATSFGPSKPSPQ